MAIPCGALARLGIRVGMINASHEASQRPAFSERNLARQVNPRAQPALR